ncbi:MAG: flagellar biosynthetic protein FliO [Bryobacterales bacterium]|nr:flagellar biosynthetic protein FliO [Bryobacteraceae bacterium]MDW8355261.1 flagellar biosynthetic protein FliO [Bryobacterales bacterium]
MRLSQAVRWSIFDWLARAWARSLSAWRRDGRGSLTGAARGERQLERLERLPLSPQHSLYLVRVAGRALLLGVSPAGIQVLERVRRPEALGSREGDGA